MLIQYFGRLIGRAFCAMVALFGLAQTQHAIAATVYTYGFEQTNFAYNGGAEAG
jgi:hypothetical protein